MVVALGPGKFYGSGLPRPHIYRDMKLNEKRIDPPVPVLDPLMSWANDVHWSMGGLSFKRQRLQGRIEGSIKILKAEQEKMKGTVASKAAFSPPPPVLDANRRRKILSSSGGKEPDVASLGIEISHVYGSIPTKELDDKDFMNVAASKDRGLRKNRKWAESSHDFAPDGMLISTEEKKTKVGIGKIHKSLVLRGQTGGMTTRGRSKGDAGTSAAKSVEERRRPPSRNCRKLLERSNVKSIA